ncbi:MAG: hypothetical protein P8172_07980 [Gammaproteobacteria bacterium]|jgi:cytochrome c553
MKKMMTLIALPLVFFGASAHADAHMEMAKAKFEAVCSDCHYADDFEGTPKDEVKAMIKGVVSGATEHDEDLSGLTDDEIDAMAEFYSKGGA